MGPYFNVAIVVAVVVGMVLLFRTISRAGEQLAADQAAREQRATTARATVVAIDKSGAQVRNGTVLIELRLRLDDADGREVRGYWELLQGQIGVVHPGAAMSVRVDADDPGLCFPTIPGATHSLLTERMAKQQQPPR